MIVLELITLKYSSSDELIVSYRLLLGLDVTIIYSIDFIRRSKFDHFLYFSVFIL